MTVYQWDQPSAVARADVARGKRGQNALQAVLYPPEDAETAARLAGYLKEKGFEVYDASLKEPDRDALDVTGFDRPEDARYAEIRLRRVGFTAAYDEASGVLHVEGSNAKPALGEVYREFAQKGYDVTATPLPGKETPILRVRGQGPETALFSALASGGFVSGETPKDRFAGKNFLERLRIRFLENPKRYSGVSNLIAAVINVTSGVLRGNFGEAAMGAGFATSNVNLTIGPRAPVNSEEVFNRVLGDFTVAEGKYDFSKSTDFTTTRGGYGRTTDNFLEFRDNYATEIAGMFNVVSGSMAARGGYIDGKKHTVLEGEAKYPTALKDKAGQAGKDIASGAVFEVVGTGVRGRKAIMAGEIPDVALDEKTGRPKVEKQWDTPYTFSGPLLVLGYLPALLVPPKGTHTKPLINYEKFGERIRSIPLLGPAIGGLWDSAPMDMLRRSPVGKFFDAIIDQPRKWAGTLGVIHSGQQILFALREGLLSNPAWLEGYKIKFSRETEQLRERIGEEPFRTILEGVDQPIVEREHPRRKGTAYQLSDEAIAAYKKVIAEYEAAPERSDVTTYRAALLLGSYNLEDVSTKARGEKVPGSYQKLIDLHEKTYGALEAQASPQEQRQYQEALNRKNYDEMHEKRNYFVRRLAAFSLLFVGNFLFSRIDAKRGEIPVDAAETTLDRVDVYRRAAEFLKSQPAEMQEQAREKFALALSLQPEFAGVSKEQIAEDIQASMEGAPTSLERAARALYAVRATEPASAPEQVEEATTPPRRHTDKVASRPVATLLDPSSAPAPATPSL